MSQKSSKPSKQILKPGEVVYIKPPPKPKPEPELEIPPPEAPKPLSIPKQSRIALPLASLKKRISSQSPADTPPPPAAKSAPKMKPTSLNQLVEDKDQPSPITAGSPVLPQSIQSQVSPSSKPVIPIKSATPTPIPDDLPQPDSQPITPEASLPAPPTEKKATIPEAPASDSVEPIPPVPAPKDESTEDDEPLIAINKLVAAKQQSAPQSATSTASSDTPPAMSPLSNQPATFSPETANTPPIRPSPDPFTPSVAVIPPAGNPVSHLPPSQTIPNFTQSSADTSAQSTAIPLTVPTDDSNPPADAPPLVNVLASQAVNLQPAGSAAISSSPRLKKSYIIFSLATALLVIGTIIFILFLAWPNIRGIIHSKHASHQHQFEDVLVNLLQVQNYDLRLDISQPGIQSLIPHFDDGVRFSEASVAVSSHARVQLNQPSQPPYLDAQFKFDITSLRSDGQKSNVVLDISTMFQADGQALFKLNDFIIDNQRIELDDAFSQRWSDLESLLQAHDQLVLPTNTRSRILDYATNFLRYYSTYQYLVLLPSFNITDSRDYNEIKQELLSSRAYSLDASSCQPSAPSGLRCDLDIDHGRLYEFYRTVYAEILEEPLPSYYNLLNKIGGEIYLPQSFQITFDQNTNWPTALVYITPDRGRNLNMEIDYDNFDDPTFDRQIVDDPLDIREYYQQVLEYEQNTFQSP